MKICTEFTLLETICPYIKQTKEGSGNRAVKAVGINTNSFAAVFRFCFFSSFLSETPKIDSGNNYGKETSWDFCHWSFPCKVSLHVCSIPSAQLKTDVEKIRSAKWKRKERKSSRWVYPNSHMKECLCNHSYTKQRVIIQLAAGSLQNGTND